MKTRNQEQGSTLHIAIVIILVIIILALLGYVFYNQLTTKSSTPNTTTSTTKDSTTQDTPADPGYAYFSGGKEFGLPVNVKFEYPTNWQVVDSAHSAFGSVGNDTSAMYHDQGSMYLQTANTEAGYAAKHDGGQQDNQATIIITLDTRYTSLDAVKTANYQYDGQVVSGNPTITTHVYSFTFDLGVEKAVAYYRLYTRSNGNNDTKAEYNNNVTDVQDFFVEHDSKVYRIFVNGHTIANSELQPVINKLISTWKWL